MDVTRSLVKLAVGTGCVLGGLACSPILAEAGIVWGPVLASFLGNVAAGNTANAIDALTAGKETDTVSLENQDLTKAVGKAIAAVITIAAKQHRGKTHDNLEKIASQATNNWVKIAQQELTQQRYPQLREAKLDQFLTPEEYSLTQDGNLTATEWGDIFIRLNMAACKGGGFPIPPEVRQQVAELLHTTFPKALRETLKEDFANDGKAFAGLTLQLLTGMKAELTQLRNTNQGVNAAELTQILQEFQQLETQLRGTVAQQQAFFRQISEDIDSGFAEVCQQLGVMETNITALLQNLEKRLEALDEKLAKLEAKGGKRQLSKQKFRNRQNLLGNMRSDIEDRLTQSLHHAVLLNLGKEQQPHQVQRPWDISVKVGEQRSFQLPSKTSILEVFENPVINGKFLILGKPGGGKTTTLLELAQALVERAETDSDAPIPVILELSAWQTVTKRKFLPFGEKEKYDPSIKEWILSQLWSKGVSQEIGEKWIKQKELVLLLDGLDELPSERQAKCVRAINQFLDSEFSPLHLVVCSRKEEYEEYKEVLHLNGAICLEDLTVEQMRNNFASVNLGEFWESIKDSEKIVNFIRQPLFLAITSIAYQQIDVEEWRNCNTEERAIDYLIGIYCVVALGEEDIKLRSNFSQERIKKIKLIHGSLIYLAKYLESCKNQNFVVKNLQPFFLIQGEIFYQKTTFFVSVSFFLFFVYIINLILTKFNFDISSIILNFLSLLSFNSWQEILISIAVLSLIIFLIAIPLLLPAFLVFALFFYVYHEDNSININKFNLLNPFIAYRFTLYLIYSFYFLFSASLCIGFILLVFLILSEAQTGKTDINILRSILKLLSFSVSFSVIISPFYTLHEAILKNLELELRQTEKFDLSALFVNVLSIVIFCSLYYQISLYLLTKVNIMPDVFSSIHPLGISVYIGVVCGGGYDLFKYFILRLIIFKFKYMPWNITRFLDYCTERLILQRVGNRYRFIHRLVQEHFANLEIQKE